MSLQKDALSVGNGSVPEERIFELSREELDSLPYGVITLDRLGTIVRYNYAEATFARRTTEGTIGLGFFTDVAPCTNVQAFKGRFDDFARHSDSGVDRFDFTFAFRWGSQDVSITLLRKAGHDEINLIVRGRMQATLDIAPGTIAQHNTSSQAGPVNQSIVSPMFGLGTQGLDFAAALDVGSAEDLAWRGSIHPDDVVSARRTVEEAAARREPYVIEYRLLAVDQQTRLVQELGTFPPGTEFPGHATMIDVTERRRHENDLWRLAHYDRRTGLPNRALLLRRITAAAGEVCDTNQIAAILALVITRVGSHSEHLDHATRDELLRQSALRLGESVRGGDTVARLDGDVFAVLMTGIDGITSVTAAGQRILNAVLQPYPFNGSTHYLSASLGISLTPRNGSDAIGLLQAAETAMVASQNRARNDIVWFSTDLSTEVDETSRTELELRAALERGEFVLHYQPIVDAKTSEVVALEALVRWNHPTRGLVMPGSFIPVAERSGLIGALGDWVLRDASRQARLWLDLGLDLHVCVNVSAAQFRQPSFVDYVSSVLAEASIPPHMIELELTESIMVDGFSAVIETLSKLKLIGVRLSIDDFGTGYSSLSYLKYFPIDTLKIDRAFVADMVMDRFDRAIVKAILALATDLQLDCIAEGVETIEQLELLRELGCPRIQGYYFSRPVLPDELTRLPFRNIHELS